MNRHISHQYDYELDSVGTRLMEMGGRVERMLRDAIDALAGHDGELAQAVREADRAVNQAELDLDEACVEIIALRQPAARDLRTLIAIMRASTDLERIGDESCRIAKAAQALQDVPPPDDRYAELRTLYEQVAGLLSGALDSLARQDVDQALQLIERDEAIDDGYDAIVRQTLGEMHERPDEVERGINLIWAARALERVGDHATNLCEYVVFLVRGKDVRHPRAQSLNAPGLGGQST